MSMQPNYPRIGNHARQFYPSPPSMHTSDSGYGSSREMGPPSLDFPPQPIEIDLSNSRTLPSPSPSSSVAWENTLFPSSTYTDMNSTSAPMARIQQLPVDRSTAQAPLLQWYTDNDGPWYPKGISEGVTEGRAGTKAHTGNRASAAFGQYRQQNPLDNGTFQFGAPPQSDSGYGTRRSIGNASIFSVDPTDRDQDCQSLTSHVADFQPFQGMNDVLQTRDARPPEHWSIQLPLPATESPGFVCPHCHKTVKTKSELKKHDLRHRKPFMCTYAGCTRDTGFSTTNDLDRHVRSKHPLADKSKKYRCHIPGCKSKDKAWPRLDNFRSHLKRVHQNVLQTEEDRERTIQLAEFYGTPAVAQVQHSFSSPKPTARSQSDARDAALESLPNPRQDDRSGWKSGYPNLIQDLVTPVDKPFIADDGTRNSSSTIDLDVPQQSPHSRETIQPSALLRDPMKGINKISLENMLSAPVGLKSTIDTSSKETPRPSEVRDTLPSEGKATRHDNVSVKDAAITEVIRTALAEAKITSSTSIGALPLGRKVLPNGKPTSADSGVSMQGKNASALSNDVNKQFLSTFKEPSLDQEKAIQVLKTLQELGYIIQKDPNQSPRIQNAGSAASNKSEKQVVCQTCKKFKGRPCELNKHMKRHEKPYGCTFLTCNKIFGSKNDWKRHENSQHFQVETWRCDKPAKTGEGACAKLCYRRAGFQTHLENEHHMPKDSEAVRAKLDTCRIGRNCQARFWCGFCQKLIDLKKKGLEAWTERFDHIDNHFMGRNELPKQNIRDWVPVDSVKPKGDVSSPHSLGGEVSSSSQEDSNSSDSNTSGRSSPAAAEGRGDSQANAIVLNGDEAEREAEQGSEKENRLKRKRTRGDGDDGAGRANKHTKVTEIVYCCQCEDDTGHTLSQICFSCNHRFCGECKKDSIE